jgi:hypothetical protein
MNLPYGELLIFAKETLQKTDSQVQVNCNFPVLPTLAMFIEAAAQSSSAFHTTGEVKMGFLTMVLDCKLLGEIRGKEYLFEIYKENEVGQYKKFSFVALSKVSMLKVVSGNFTIYVEN